MLEKRLKCTVGKGMFSRELVVVFKTGTGETISVFVPKDCVRGSIGSEGVVKVQVFEDKGKQWALLPSAEGETVTITKEDLVPA